MEWVGWVLRVGVEGGVKDEWDSVMGWWVSEWVVEYGEVGVRWCC